MLGKDKHGVFPLTAKVNDQGHLAIGGCDVVELASAFGTPLYLFDEFTLRYRCREMVREFGQRYPDMLVAYASKAFLSRKLAALISEEGMGLDVVSEGELSVASSVSFPMDRVYFHGNNKSPHEILVALKERVGCIVVDNFHELTLLGRLASEAGIETSILLRVTPGVDPHTHRYIATGLSESKFGFPLSTADDAVGMAMALPGIRLRGFHFHIGSSIYEPAFYSHAIDIIIKLAARLGAKCNFELDELDVGGGFAVQYTRDEPAPPASAYAEVICNGVRDRCRELGLPLPRLVVEPGRYIVGQAGVAIYSVGATKDIPGVVRYIFVDGGMGDNIRPALYGARYEAVVANKMNEPESEEVRMAGRFCESGDILIDRTQLGAAESGDIVAVATCGAYCLPMASNYNLFPRPAVVLVRDGSASLMHRRESLDDLMRLEVM